MVFDSFEFFVDDAPNLFDNLEGGDYRRLRLGGKLG